MNHPRLKIAAGFIACIILVAFLSSIVRTRTAVAPEAMPQTERVAIPSAPLLSVDTTYKKGVYTITGFITAPDACTMPVADARLQGDASSTERIMVDVELIEDVGICLEIPSDVEFETELEAPADLPIDVSVNGVFATTTGS